MTKLAVIGAGSMGLAAAYHALKAGHEVTVFEAGPVAGGMAAHFDFGGLSLERYYHFICKSDQPTFDLCEELGIASELRWRATSMGYYIDGRHYKWGDPISLLTFPRLGLISKFRYGLHMFACTRRRNFDDLENVDAATWIIKGCGQKVYDLLWRRLFHLKFFEFENNISAAWIATRIKRIGKSRRSLLQEELGYLQGGSETLIQALGQAIVVRGGHLKLGTNVQAIETKNGRVTGVRTQAGFEPYDAVISTAPTPYVADMIPDMAESLKDRYRKIPNIGVICVVLKLRQSVTPHFWVNINDPAIEIPGIIEFSNLRPVSDAIVYVPYYMPHTHRKWAWTDEQLIAESFAAVRALNPAIQFGDLIDSHVARLRYAQPICGPGFQAMLPPIQTEIAGLQVADTCFYYPEDRGIAESVRLGKEMAAVVAQ